MQNICAMKCGQPLQMILLALLCFFFTVQSGTATKCRTKPKFHLNSISPVPKQIFTLEVLRELGNLEETQHLDIPFETSKRLEELVRIHKEEIKDTKSIIKNYYLVETGIDKVAYYMIHSFDRLARINPSNSSIEAFAAEYIMNGSDDEVEYLLRTLALRFDLIRSLAYLLVHFIDNGKSRPFNKIIQFCPGVVNTHLEFKTGARLTPLAVAAEVGHSYMVDALIDAGADVNALVIQNPKYGEIPVIYAAFSEFNHSILVAELIKDSPAFRKELCFDSHGYNPAFYMIDHNIDVSKLSYAAIIFGWAGSTFSNTSIMDAFGFAIWRGRQAHASILTYLGDFNVAKTDDSGSTYLMLAAEFDCSRVIKRIYEIPGAKEHYQLRPGYCNNNGDSAMKVAISRHSYDALEELLKHASEFEVNDENGANPLVWSIFCGDERSAKLVLEHPQVSLDALMRFNVPGRTVLDYAKIIASPNIWQILSEFQEKQRQKRA